MEKSDIEKFANARLLVNRFRRNLRPFNILERTGSFGYIKDIKKQKKHPHNRQTICRNIYEFFDKFELELKGGSNIVADLKLRNMNRLQCSVHSLHRFIVHDVFNNKEFSVFANMIGKLKSVIIIILKI